jgi:hypothetical protein
VNPRESALISSLILLWASGGIDRRLWPPLVRLANRFLPDQIAKVCQEHTASGRHVNKEVPFSRWVPAEVTTQASSISEAEAIAALGQH